MDTYPNGCPILGPIAFLEQFSKELRQNNPKIKFAPRRPEPRTGPQSDDL